MGRVVIAAYRPRAGRDEALREIALRHWGVLDRQGLVTGRAPCLMQAADGTVVEVFEWASAEAIERAHADPVVQQLWAEFSAACEFVPVGQLPEAGQLFSEFSPLVP